MLFATSCKWSVNGLWSVIQQSHAQRSNYSPLQKVIGKVEGVGHEWHGHVTAITVAPEYRRLHLGKNMMDLLERISDEVYHGFFVDLYVRLSNDKAIDMYERLGYSVYRRVRQYYSGSTGPGNTEDEDAYGTYGFRIELPQSQLILFQICESLYLVM